MVPQVLVKPSFDRSQLRSQSFGPVAECRSTATTMLRRGLTSDLIAHQASSQFRRLPIWTSASLNQPACLTNRATSSGRCAYATNAKLLRARLVVT